MGNKKVCRKQLSHKAVSFLADTETGREIVDYYNEYYNESLEAGYTEAFEMVTRYRKEITWLKQENQRLKDEITRLRGLI